MSLAVCGKIDCSPLVVMKASVVPPCGFVYGKRAYLFAGGYATLAGLTFTPDLYCCGVDVVGPSNIDTLFKVSPVLIVVPPLACFAAAPPGLASFLAAHLLLCKLCAFDATTAVQVLQAASSA